MARRSLGYEKAPSFGRGLSAVLGVRRPLPSAPGQWPVTQTRSTGVFCGPNLRGMARGQRLQRTEVVCANYLQEVRVRGRMAPMTYTATLAGQALKKGTMQEIQAASMEVLTELLAEDPDGVAMSAVQANRDFQTGSVGATVASVGEWRCPIWVHGEARTLIVTKEG